MVIFALPIISSLGRINDVEILNMVDFRHFASHFTHDSDDIEAPRIVDFSIVEVVVDGEAQIFPLLVVNGLYRICEVTVASRLHLDEHYPFPLPSYDVDVAVC